MLSLKPTSAMVAIAVLSSWKWRTMLYRLTAERVRRVINGYDFQGTRKTQLLREKLNWRVLTNASCT